MTRITWGALVLALATAAVAAEPREERRERASKALQQKDYKDAYADYRALALDPGESGAPAGESLKAAIECLGELARGDEVDELRDAVIAAHHNQWRLLLAAAETYGGTAPAGYLVANRFHRGWSPDQTGQLVYCVERDRVLALRLLSRALELARKDADRAGLAELHLAFARFLLMQGGRHELEAGWKLQLLTDLGELPDFEKEGNAFEFTPAGAPVGTDGLPVLFHRPDSYEAARNDGERWRWHLARSIELDPARRGEAQMELAGFLRGQFDVGTVALRDEPGQVVDDEQDGDLGPFAVAGLREEETLARLATGVKRLSLPDEFNFLKIYRSVAEGDAGRWGENALDALGSALEDRRQYPRAAEVWRQAIRRYGRGEDGFRARRLDQIVVARGEFGPTRVQPAGKPATVEFRYRNARSVRFEAHEVLVPKLLEEARTYLDSRRIGMRFHVEEFWPRLIDPRKLASKQQPYLGPLVASWDLALDPKAGHLDRRIVVETPLRKPGQYLLSARVPGGGLCRVVVAIEDTVIVKKRSPGGRFFFVADASTGRPVPDAILEFLGYRADVNPANGRIERIETRRFTRTAGPEGHLTVDNATLDLEFEWLTIARTSSGRFAFIGFGDRWYPHINDSDPRRLRTFVITDRPIYRPGQPVKFKGWARHAPYDGPNDRPESPRSVRVKITNPRNETVLERDYATDNMGGFDGEYTPPRDASLGLYSLTVVGRAKEDVRDGAEFRVEEYRKPEYAVKIDTPPAPVRLGERFTATVQARYHFGTPVRQARVRFHVTRTRDSQSWFPEGRWDWLYGPGYVAFARHHAWPPGRRYWRTGATGPPTRGLTEVDLARFRRRIAVSEWDSDERDGPIDADELRDDRVELIQQGEVPIDVDGTVEITIDTAPALGSHPGVDYRYDIAAEVVDGSRRTVIGTSHVLVAGRPFEAFARLDRGYYRPGQEIVARLEARAAGQQPVGAKGKATLLRIRYEEERPVEEAVESWTIATSRAGECELRLSAAEPGQYRLAFTLDDGTKRAVECTCVFVVADERFDGTGLRFDDLELIPDRREYAPGDRARLLVNANRPGATVLLFVRAAHGKVGPARVLRLEGKSTSIEIGIDKRDVPNIFIEGLTISDGKVHREIAEILVPPQRTTLNVAVSSTLPSYRPGAPAKVAVKLTDEAGKPFVGSAALTIYDKGLEYLAEGSNFHEIRTFFWGRRREHDARQDSNLVGGSENAVAEGQDKMESIGLFGDRAVWGEPLQYSFAARSRETAEHGDDDPVIQAATTTEVQAHVRKSFADTAHWSPSLTTNHEGIAEVTLTMPENLTTWKIRAWGIGAGTEVGEGEAETVTTKPLLVRLNVPRFLVQGDAAVLSAWIHNELATDQPIRVRLELDALVLELLDDSTRTVRVKSRGALRVDWKVRVVSEGEAIVRVKALGDEESDATELRFPAVAHGRLKTDSFAGSIRRDTDSARLAIVVPEARRRSDTRVEIRVSPTIAGALVDALPYLADYPYGCTEQTLNRFLPTVIAQGVLRRMGVDLASIREKRTNLNPRELGAPSSRVPPPQNPVFDEARVRAMAVGGLKALASMQLADGSWGWFSGSGERPDAHLTALVVHGLRTGRASGLEPAPGLLERGTEWLKTYQSEQVRQLTNAAIKDQPFRSEVNDLDALVCMVLTEAGVPSAEMLDLLDRDRSHLSVYGLTLLGLALEEAGRNEPLRRVVHTIEQYLVTDPENQTAYLRLPEDARWRWYANDIETQACYLKLLARTDPGGATAPALVKYLLNNRRHATYWDSTRDTALCIEAMAEYLKASGEDRPEMDVEISVDGKPRKQVTIGPDNLISFDGTLVLTGDEVATGAHTIELTRRGRGPLYFNAYLTYFTLEDPIRRSGVELKVDRKLYRVRSEIAERQGVWPRGEFVTRPRKREVRDELTPLSRLESGDVVEVELILESKNDYEYLLIEDRKPAGFEPVALRSGYNGNDLGAYMELRDQAVCFFARSLARGRHSVRYRVRAEIPGKFAALPVVAFGMYAPELYGNSDEAKVAVEEVPFP